MHEIIHVVDAAARVAGRQLEIEAVSGHPLAPGYYFVLWPVRKAARRRGKRYFGPFRTAAQARMLRTSALMLGLADDSMVRQSIAECRSTVRYTQAANDCHPAFRNQLPRAASGSC